MPGVHAIEWAQENPSYFCLGCGRAWPLARWDGARPVGTMDREELSEWLESTTDLSPLELDLAGESLLALLRSFDLSHS